METPVKLALSTFLTSDLLQTTPSQSGLQDEAQRANAVVFLSSSTFSVQQATRKAIVFRPKSWKITLDVFVSASCQFLLLSGTLKEKLHISWKLFLFLSHRNIRSIRLNPPSVSDDLAQLFYGFIALLLKNFLICFHLVWSAPHP